MSLLNKVWDLAGFWVRRSAGLAPKAMDEEWRRLQWLVHEPRGSSGRVTWQGLSLRYADGAAFHSQLHEVFVQPMYDFSVSNRTAVVVDCGAHVGLVSIRWSRILPQVRILAIEADPNIAAMLADNFTSAGVADYTIVAKAAWVHNQGVSFRQTGVDNGHVDDSLKDEELNVPSFDLADVMPDEVDFLKMDVEGAEFQLLPHLANRGKLRGVRRIFIELHQWGNEISRIPEAMHILQQEGFDCRIVGSVLFKPQGAALFSKEGWANSHVLVAGRRDSFV